MKKLLILALALILTGITTADAISRCPGCAYLVNSDTWECPKCLKLLRWQFVPGRSRKGTVIVRTGSDAFIRHPHAINRSWRADRNAGADLTGEIGAWGGPTTLRYLLKFDIQQSFALAGVDLAEFKLKRAFLKIDSVDNGQQVDMPVVVYPLSRPFLEGTGRFRLREKKSDGCDWYFSAPLLTWHIDGGDFEQSVVCRGTIKGGGNTTLIDVTEILKLRMKNFSKTHIWEDPGMIIMADPQKNIAAGFVTIYSLDSGAHGDKVRSPELFIE